MSATSQSQPISLFSVTGPRFGGQKSSIDPAALADGEFALARNFRADSVALKCRDGIATFRAAPVITSGTNTLASTCVARSYARGSDYIAMRTASDTRILKYFSGAWTEVTTAGTRFGTTGRISFERVSQPYPGATIGAYVVNATDTRDFLIVQDGVASPRISNISTGTPAVYSISAISAPATEFCAATPMPISAVNIVGLIAGNITYSTGSDFRPSLGTLTGSGQYLGLTASTTATSTDISQITCSAAWTAGQARQFQIIFNSQDLDFWSNVAVSLKLRTGSGTATHHYIHYPGYTEPVTANAGDKYYAAGWDMTNGMAVLGTWVDLTAYDNFTEIRFEWVSASPVADKTASVYAMVVCGGIPYGTEFGVSFFNNDTQVESAGAICKNERAVPLKSVVGCTPVPNVRFAEDAGFSYRYQVTYRSPGTDFIPLIYTAPPQTEGELFIIDRNPGSCGAANVIDAVNLYTLTTGNWVMPDAGIREIPKGKAMCASGNRLLVSNGAGISSGPESSVAFSEQGYPLRFRFYPKVKDNFIDPLSGGVASFGTEEVQRIIARPSGVGSGDQPLVYTNKAFYSMEGYNAAQMSKPSKIAEFGTLSPDGFAVWGDTVIWLDNHRQIRQYGSGVDGLSALEIEDVLKAIPAGRLDDVAATVCYDKFYLAYSPAGTTENSECVVWDSRISKWVYDETDSSYRFVGWCPSEQSGEVALLFTSTDGATLQYEKPGQTTDAGTDISIKLRSKGLSRGLFNMVRIDKVGVVADDQGSGKTWTTTLIERKSGVSTTGKLNMDGSGEKVVRLHRGTNNVGERPGSAGIDVQVDIEGPMIGGTSLYALTASIEVVKQDAADIA